MATQNQNPNWAAKEVIFNKKDLVNKNVHKQTILEPSLSDIMIIRKWIDYAKGIGDHSVKFFDHQNILYPEIYGIAKSRIN